MGTFNSAQDGNWNTDATWAEAGHPTANDDVTILTHDVTYDVGVSAVTWGNCTINSGGILIFPIAANSKMLFSATGVLTINSGGELRAGTSGSPIGSGFLCQLHWPQGAAGRNVLALSNGGKIDIYGDPAYYGSAKTAILDSEWNAGGGLTLYVEGDYSSKWAAGQHFVIHDFAQYVNYATDAESFEIDSVGAYDAGNSRTPIVVTAAGDSDTFLVGAKLWMLSRNVEILDPGSSWAINGFATYTEYLRFASSQDIARGAASNVNCDEAIFRGWQFGVYGGDGFTSDGLVMLNCSYGLRDPIYAVITDGLFVSCDHAFYTVKQSEIGADFIACNYAFLYGSGLNIIGDIISCAYALNFDYAYLQGNIYSCLVGANAVGITMIGNIEKNTYGTGTATRDLKLIGDIKDCSSYGTNAGSGSIIGSITGCGSGVYAPNTLWRLKNGAASGNTSDTSGVISAIITRAVVFEDYTIGGTKRELEIYANAGNILCFHNGDAHWQAPPSGESFILEMLSNSYCNVASSEWLSLTPDPLNMMFTYVTSGAQTLTFKIYPVGWTSSLDNDDIVLEAFYLAGAGVGRTRVVNTTATYANGAWRDLEVSFTTGQAGIVYFAIHLKKYEAGDYVLIDPEWTIS